MGAVSKILGKSKHSEHLRKLTAKLAANRKDVLIVGENGVGKSTIASAITGEEVSTFMLSAIHETELLVRLSSISRGTVLFEGIDDAGFRIHDVVLKFVESRPKDVRIIAILNSPTKELLVLRKLSENLCARINSFELVEVRPLRERPEDIPLLVKSFANGLIIDINTLETLVTLPWKGNISQLKSVVERCIASANDGRFMLPEELIDDRTEVVKVFSGLMESQKPILDKSLDAIENTIIRRTLERFGFDVPKAAEFLGMTEQVFGQKLNRLAIAKANSH